MTQKRLSDVEYSKEYLKHLDLIKRCYKKVSYKYYSSDHLTTEDREAELYIKLKERESFEKYDPSRRENFESYMYFQIRSIVGHMREKDSRALSRECLKEHTGDHQRLMESIPDGDDIDEGYRHLIQDFSSQLDAEQADVLRMLALEGYTGSEIATIRGTYDMRISRVLSSLKGIVKSFLVPNH